MDRESIKTQALVILQSIAPEIEPEAIRPARALRSQVDLDSMDWLRFLVALHERFAVEIPESDYARLATLDDVANYLAAKLGLR